MDSRRKLSTSPEDRDHPMRYALHYREDSTEFKFKTLKDLWAHVRANDLCSEQTDIGDVASARRLLRPKYEIHDFDACGVVRVEGRAPPRNID
jgi:hypothetical protein